MATDISELMGGCTCEELPNTVKRKCESIINILYYLNDINGWMYDDNHWEIRSSDNSTTNITDEDHAWADIEIEKHFQYNSSQDSDGNITESIIRNPDYSTLIDIKRRLDTCEDAIGNDIEDNLARCHNAIIEILNMIINVSNVSHEAVMTIPVMTRAVELNTSANNLKSKLVGNND